MPNPPPRDEFDDPLPASIWELLNVSQPRSTPDRFAPEVDRDLLRRLVRKEISPGMVRAAYRLIHAFDSWKRAYADIVVDEFRRSQRSHSRRSHPDG